jgi:hypothetical protein
MVSARWGLRFYHFRWSLSMVRQIRERNGDAGTSTANTGELVLECTLESMIRIRQRQVQSHRDHWSCLIR